MINYCSWSRPSHGHRLVSSIDVSRERELAATVLTLVIETITGDDTLIVEISTQYCNDYGSCTDASVVAVDRGLQIVRSEKL